MNSSTNRCGRSHPRNQVHRPCHASFAVGLFILGHWPAKLVAGRLANTPHQRRSEPTDEAAAEPSLGPKVGRGVPAEPALSSRPRWWGERTREPSLLIAPPARAGERHQGRLIEDDSPYLPVDGGRPEGRARRPGRAGSVDHNSRARARVNAARDGSSRTIRPTCPSTAVGPKVGRGVPAEPVLLTITPTLGRG
jgi:hypothetical protein